MLSSIYVINIRIFTLVAVLRPVYFLRRIYGYVGMCGEYYTDMDGMYGEYTDMDGLYREYTDMEGMCGEYNVFFSENKHEHTMLLIPFAGVYSMHNVVCYVGLYTWKIFYIIKALCMFRKLDVISYNLYTYIY